MADLNLNKTTSVGVSPLMQAVLNRHLIETAKPTLVHTQFGQKVKIPKGQTKTVTWDKMSPLPKAKTPLAEGVTPDGAAVHITRITGTPDQYGNYISFTDQLDFFAHDPSPKVLNYNELLGNNAAETLESVASDILSGSTNVQYAGGVAARASITASLTVTEVRKAVRTLKRNKAKKFGADYICIVHTDVAHDLMSDNDWKYPHMYKDTKQLYEGEIGELYGVRFIESPEAKVFYGTKIGGVWDELSVLKADATAKKIYVQETITSAVASAVSSGTKILIGGVTFTVSGLVAGSNGDAYFTTSANTNYELISPDMKAYPGDGTASGKPVYSTLVFGQNAYGTTGLKETLETLAKGLGSAGTADPLNQRGTMGWKAYHLTKVLVPEHIVRIESIATA